MILDQTISLLSLPTTQNRKTNSNVRKTKFCTLGLIIQYSFESKAGNTILGSAREEFCQDGKAVICTAETLSVSSGTLRIILDICQK